jgi:hypothetical protein
MNDAIAELQKASILRQVQALGEGTARHFALVDYTADDDGTELLLRRAVLRSKYGVEPILFNRGPNYRGLSSLLKHLSKPRDDRRADLSSDPPRARSELSRDRVWADNPAFPDDPLKGRFGWESTRDDWRMSARVVRSNDKRWPFWVKLEIAPRPGSNRRLKGRVDFFVHNTFQTYFYSAVMKRKQRENRLRFTLWCWGAFTVGAYVYDTNTPLELDLADVAGAPIDFIAG